MYTLRLLNSLILKKVNYYVYIKFYLLYVYRLMLTLEEQHTSYFYQFS